MMREDIIILELNWILILENINMKNNVQLIHQLNAFHFQFSFSKMNIQINSRIFIVCLIITISSRFEDENVVGPSILDQIILDSSKFLIMVEKIPAKVPSLLQSKRL